MIPALAVQVKNIKSAMENKKWYNFIKNNINMFRVLKIILIVGLLGFVAWGILNFEIQNRQLQNKINNLKTSASVLEKENQSLKENIEYFSQPDNLMKELKSLFNYRQPGEKMMIIVPRD
jgi:cell division protein FtsB